MSVFIGSTTPTQRACLSKEFKKLYTKKTFIPRKQKIAIALNTCDVGIKGVKKDNVRTIALYIEDEGTLNLIKKTPSLKQMFTASQLKDLKEGKNILRVNNYIFSRLENLSIVYVKKID
jgi:hypothetical protein